MSQKSDKRDPLLVNKIVGALCIAGLVFLFGRWGAEALTHRGVPDVHHGDEHAEDGHGEGEMITQAYTIEVEGAGAEGGEEAAGADFGGLMAAADPAKGEKVFGKCKACHSLEAGKNGTGPSLNGVVGRKPGSEPGFKYSDAMVAFGDQAGTWSPEILIGFLGDVKGTVRGTNMSFAGIKDPAQSADLVAFLMGDAFNAGDFSAAAPAASAEAEAPAEEAPATEVAAGDAAKGENVFKKCKACHSVEPGKNGTGPSLFGVVGRKPGTEAGFKFSEAMIAYGDEAGAWEASNLDAFIADVKGTVKGTKMSFPGVKDAGQRADLIAYLETFK